MGDASTLSHAEARRVYDRVGWLQDTQAFYEDAATRQLLEHGAFASARRVFEFGCGTGRLARTLLSRHLPESAEYRGIDLSPKMVALARRRLASYSGRAEAVLSEGGPPVDEPGAAYDRFLSTFVLDLLPEEEVEAVLAQAHRMLEPGGRLCLASLSTGAGPVSHAVARAWTAVHRRWPALVGGCRPLDLASRVDPSRWRVLHDEKLAPFGMPCEALVAERVADSVREEPPVARP